MKNDNGNSENNKKVGAGKKSPGKKKTSRTSSAKKKSGTAAKTAKKITFKKLPDFSAEVSKELTEQKKADTEEDLYKQVSIAAPYIDEKFADEKFISHRRVGDYYYSVYIKPCQPEIRDALIFLNISSNKDIKRDVVAEDEEADEFRLKAAADELLSYIYKNCGLLRLFFTRVRDYYPITSVAIRPLLFWEDLTLEKVIEVIDWNSDKDLFCILLDLLHNYRKMPLPILQNAMKDRERFYTFLEGASYTPEIKADLTALYEACNFNDPEKPSVKEMLFQFLTEYFEEFKIRFESIRDIIEKERERMKGEIEKYGEIPYITDQYLFRRMIMNGKSEKTICVEKLAFSMGNVEYFSTGSTCVICVGHGFRMELGGLCDYERIGVKLKNFTDDATTKILGLLSRTPGSIEKIMEVTGMNKDAVYRLTTVLIEQQILIKNDKTNEFVLNRDHLMKIIRLLEKYGGITS